LIMRASNKGILIGLLAASLVGVVVFNFQSPSGNLMQNNAPGEAISMGSASTPLKSDTRLEMSEQRTAAQSNIWAGYRPAYNVDWRRFPRGIAAHAAEAIETGNGDLAWATSEALRRCKAIDVDVEVHRQLIGSAKDSASRKFSEDQFHEAQAILSSCQTVVGDLLALRRSVLAVAVEKGIVGAAAEAYLEGGKSAATNSKLKQDALAGDLASLTIAAYAGKSEVGLSDSEVLDIRYALVLASKDVELASRAAPYRQMAQKMATVQGAIEQAETGGLVDRDALLGRGPLLDFDRPSVAADARVRSENIVSQIRLRVIKPS
jgi:hypothetical protein